MISNAELLQQRSVGRLKLRMDRDGVAVLSEEGSLKCRVPRGSTEAILINVSGGLAGGDRMDIAAAAGPDAELTITTQAAERVYRTLGPAAEVRVALSAAPGAWLSWLPHESIMFEASALSRRIDVDLAEGASFLAVEPIVFGRQAMGETLRRVSLTDHWRVRLNGRLIHAETLRLGPGLPGGNASLSTYRAIATVLVVSPKAERFASELRGRIGPADGVSAWNGKLIARLVAKDGHDLRKALLPVFSVCLDGRPLPKTWAI